MSRFVFLKGYPENMKAYSGDYSESLKYLI